MSGVHIIQLLAVSTVALHALWLLYRRAPELLEQTMFMQRRRMNAHIERRIAQGWTVHRVGETGYFAVYGRPRRPALTLVKDE